MSFGILPIEDIKSCVVSADKSADQNVENVPSGDVNKVQTSAEQSEVDFRTDKSANIGTKINHENVQKLHNDNLDKCNDLISRADVICEVLVNDGIDNIVDRINALPSADRQTDETCQDCPIYSAEEKNCPRFNKVIPQTRAEMEADRPKGEWRWTHGGQCSECGFHNTNFDFNFCPSCGADMRGEDDG